MTYNLGQEIFNRILAGAENKKIPLWAHLDLTYRCNLNCLHCYCQGLCKGFSTCQEELSLDEIKDLLDELAQAGSLYLALSGGEIFLRPDFFAVASYARRKNFCLTFFTNGTLIDDDIARGLAELSPLAVEMSIYGSGADVHDAITRKEGSFQRLLEATGLLRKYNIRFSLKSVIMEPNFHQADDIEKLCFRLGSYDYRYSIEVSPKNDGSMITKEYQISAERTQEFLAQKIKIRDRHEYWDNPLQKPLCGTGSLGCYISPYGDVYPCIQLLISMGNIRERGFKEIWHKPSQLRSKLDSLKTYQDLPDCRSCQYIRNCKKCLGLAYLETGDLKKCYNSLRCISKAEHELLLAREVDYG